MLKGWCKISSAKQAVKTLIERRQMEALKKQIGTKLTVIAQNLGRTVASAGQRQVDPRYWEEQDGWYTEDFNEIKTADDDWVEYETGWYFDALRFGVNLSVLVLTTRDESTNDYRVIEIKATYNGYVVFAEIEGKIKAYAPFKAWEDPVENIFVSADRADKRRKEREKIERVKESKSKLDQVWKMVRLLWGG